jgi:hypothetical protein
MIKLKDILLEIELEEAIVKVPQAVLAKSKEAFNYIKQYLEHFKTQAPKDTINPDIYPKFKNYFKLKNLKNQDINVSIGFYNNDKDAGAGRMDTVNNVLLINLAYLDPEDFPGFLEIIEHELVHAIDPKVRDQKLLSKMYATKGAEPAGSKINLSKSGGKSEFQNNIEKYYKSPWEFDAFTSTLVNNIKFNFQKVQDTNSKKAYRDLLNNLLSDIKTKSIEQIIDDEKYEKLPWFFSKQKWEAKNWNIIIRNYKNELDKMKTWASEPKLYQRFTKRLGTELT